MNWAWTIARVKGIPIRLHFTLLLFLPYVTYVVTAQFRVFAEWIGIETTAMTLPPLFWGALLAIGLFVGILLHELAHSVIAISSGARVHSITLMILGGISRIVGDIRSPAREAWMAAAGPLTSLAIGLVSFLLYLVLKPFAGGLAVSAFVFAWINVILAVFNFLPAFPMDGGRILRAALTPSMGRLRATRTAAMVGKGMAILFGLLGMLLEYREEEPLQFALQT